MRHASRPPEPLARSYAITHPTGTVVPYPAADWAVVVYATRGVLSVRTGGSRLTVPPHRAALLPAGSDLQLEVVGRTSLRNLYVAARLLDALDRPRVVDVTPLARELLLTAVRRAPLLRTVPPDRRLLAALLDELARLPDAPLQVPLPRDAAAATVAAAVVADPADPTPLSELARRAGLGRRTLERRFRDETGMAPARWRTRVRLVESVRLLAGGATTAAAGEAVGFATPSAFAHAFRRELGTTPSQFARGGR